MPARVIGVEALATALHPSAAELVTQALEGYLDAVRGYDRLIENESEERIRINSRARPSRMPFSLGTPCAPSAHDAVSKPKEGFGER